MSDDPNDPNLTNVTGDPDPTYKVGYKRPPLEHRFKKGRSGNIRGGKRRPKLPDIADLLNNPVRVRVNNKEEKLPPREVALLRLAVDAAQGKRKAVMEITKLILRYRLTLDERKGGRTGVVVIEQDAPWELVQLAMRSRGGTGSKLSDAALRAAWPAYKASRTAEQARIDDEIGYGFLKEIER